MEAIGRLLEQLGYGAPVLYALAAYGLFYWLDENLSDDAKAALASTMKLKHYRKEQVTSALVEIFDRIYTRPLLSWRAFARSLIFTTVVFVIYEFEVTSLKEFLLITHNLGKYLWLVRLLLAALLFNAYTDYLSLFAIRSLLIRSGTKAVMGLSLGTLSAATIIFVANVLRGLVLFLNSIDLPGVWRYPTLLWGTLSTQLFSMDTFSIWHTGALFIWPAVAVFAWLPLLALGILTIRALTPLSWIVAKAQWALREGDQHPLRAIGCVAAVAVFSIAVGLRATITT